MQGRICVESKRKIVDFYQYLQQLPLSPNGKLIDLAPIEKEKAFKLAWEAFITGDFQQRWEVSKFLPKFGESAIAPLAHLLQDETAALDLRCEAASLLGEFNTSQSLLNLTTVLNTDSESEVITACTKALSKNGKAAIPPLVNALADTENRLSAVQALAYLRQPETVEPLLSVVKDSQAEVRMTALEALSSFRHPQITEALMEALQDPYAKVRKEAVIALGVRGNELASERLVNALNPLLYDINLEVCSHCAIALGKIGTEQALSALHTCLQSPPTPDPLKRHLVRGLTHTETHYSLSLLTESLNQQPEEIRSEIIAELGRWKTPDLKPSIAETLTNFFHQSPTAQASNNIKQTLAVALGNLKKPLAKPLLDELTQDTAPIVQLHAKAALKKLS